MKFLYFDASGFDFIAKRQNTFCLFKLAGGSNTQTVLPISISAFKRLLKDYMNINEPILIFSCSRLLFS